MWPVDKITHMFDAMSAESNDEVDDYVSAQYLHLIQYSAMYTRLTRKHRLFTLLEIIIYEFILIYHLIHLGKAALMLIDVSLVTFGETIHFCLLIQLDIILIIFIQTKHNKIALFHRAMAKNFYDYSESYQNNMEELQQDIRKERMLLAMIPITVVMAVPAVLVLTPQVDQYGTFDFSKISTEFNQQLPFPYIIYPYHTEEGIGYYTAALLQVVLATILGGSIGLGGFAYIVMSQNLWIQMEILYDSVNHIEERAEILRSDLFGAKNKLSGDKLYQQVQFEYCYNICLKKNFMHHQIIM
ncbi:Odorant receptor 15, partial [Halyomorpha halys]